MIVSEISGCSVRWVGQLAVFMRETISHYFLENPIKLRNTIQIDESLFGGKRKYNRGNHSVHKKGWVFGMDDQYCIKFSKKI